jgi:LacI family transcriptional regulator
MPLCFGGSEEPIVDYDPYRHKGFSPDGGKNLAKWIRSLPKPVGIIACNDIRALQIINACRETGIRVPEEVAVIGVDNDEVICSLSRPTLSSVEQDTEAIGGLAASLVDEMLRGKKVSLFHEVSPKGIVERESTDVVVAENPLVIRAARMIRSRIDSGITMKELCAELSVSRSKLDTLFHQSLGRTPSEEIQRSRMRRCTDLLLTTDLKITEVARRCGFSSVTHLGRFFKRETGVTPLEFRASQGRTAPPGGKR